MARLSAEWIARAWAANPIQRILNPANGQPTGNIRTGPVRLSYPNIMKPGKPNDKGQSKFGASLLFPRGVDIRILQEEVEALVTARAPGVARDPQGRPYGIHVPFRDQGEKQGEGYEPGCLFINVTSNFKPEVRDRNMNPIVDESRVYPGVWAIAAINAYWFNDPKKKGVSFGLQSIMIIADDEKIGGMSSDPVRDFAGVNIEQDSGAVVAQSFGIGYAPASPQLATMPVQQLGQPADVDVNDLL